MTGRSTRYNFSPVADPVFKNYYTNPQLGLRAFTPTFPLNILLDLHLGRLPQVSWIYTTTIQSEHPPAPVEYGEAAIS